MHGSASAVLNKQLHVIGGRNDDESESRTFAYNRVSNVWIGKASIGVSRENPAAGKVKNAAGVLQIVLVGGFSNDQGEYVTATQAFTP